jgi:mannose-6-phosphate isomerase-like protein (cupin superfamily)
MKIDFNTIPENRQEHFKGGDGAFCPRMFTDDKVKIMKGRLSPGSSIGLHTHDTNSEILYILSGVGTMLCDGQEETLRPGDCHYCPQGHAHSLRNSGQEDLLFFAVVPEHH